MALFQVTETEILAVPKASFVSEGVLERKDIQQWMRKNPHILGDGEEFLIVAEEFSRWEDSRRRIDLLALDQDANLVVIELKRTEDGGLMDLQAVRYAAMISEMRFDDVVREYEEYLKRHEPEQQASARGRILQFLEASDVEEYEITNQPRIVLVSRDFSREITTTVLWLIDQGLKIRCVQIQPYKVGEQLLVDVRQIIPLAQTEDYQVRLRQKDVVARQVASGTRREETLKALARHGVLQTGTEIEIVPDARPEGSAATESSLFRAKIGDLSRKQSVIWLHDNAVYALTNLTWKLSEEHGVQQPQGKIAPYWRIVGHTENLWNEAERLGR